MCKCKNDECNNETKNGNIYCSLKCRNIYCNKNYKDYKKIASTLNEKSKIKYNKNEKTCIECGKILEYEKRRNKFCNSSCAAKYNNKHTSLEVKNKKNNSIRNALKDRFNKSNKSNKTNEYYNNPNLCIYCQNIIPYEKRKNKFCCNECLKKYKSENFKCNFSPKKAYYTQCKFGFNLSDYNDEFDFSLISKFGWYSPSNSKKPNISGVSRDHIYSISEGFKNDISPYIISHPANCQLMQHKHNLKKNTKCHITIDELIHKIELWDRKYGGLLKW